MDQGNRYTNSRDGKKNPGVCPGIKNSLTGPSAALPAAVAVFQDGHLVFTAFQDA